MYIEIIPYEKSFNNETLTYFVGASFRDKIKIWQLVKIPYWKEEIHWIVANLNLDFVNSENIEIKNISEIISEIPILSEYQINLIIKISKKYLLAIHRVLGIFLPTPIIKRLYKKWFGILEKNFWQKNLEKNSVENWEFFLTKNEIITEKFIFEKSKNISKKIIICLPDDIFLHRFKNFFQKNSNKKIGFFSNEMTDIKKSDFWISAFNWEFDIIIWTRKIIFYNLEKYDEFWYLEDSFGANFYHYPIEIAYNDILAFLFDEEKFFIKIFSSIPKIKTLSQFHFFKIFYL